MNLGIEHASLNSAHNDSFTSQRFAQTLVKFRLLSCFKGTDVLTQGSLAVLGIKDTLTVQKILNSSTVQACARVPKLDEADPAHESVADWLSSLCLSEYSSNFARGGCNDLDSVREAWQLVLRKNVPLFAYLVLRQRCPQQSTCFRSLTSPVWDTDSACWSLSISKTLKCACRIT